MGGAVSWGGKLGGVGGGNHRKGNRNVMRPRNRLWKQNGNDPRDSSAASESRASYPATWQNEHGAGDVGVLQMSVVAPLLVGLGQGPGKAPPGGSAAAEAGNPASRAPAGAESARRQPLVPLHSRRTFLAS